MTFVRYTPELDAPADDERETLAEIDRVMLELAAAVRVKRGMAMKGTHAKAAGFLKGRLVVEPGLPEVLAQGLFAEAKSFDALVRYSQGPPEPLTDKASGQRGMSIKVLGVDGPHIAESDETTTQDFVLAVDPAFNAATAKAFLANFRLTGAQSVKLPEVGVVALSKAARGAEALLESVGLENKSLKFFGRPPRHPVSDAYHSQAPVRYGDHIVKVGIFPQSATLTHIGKATLDDSSRDMFRDVTEAHFREHDAVYDLKVQLCTNLGTMPIDDASVTWPEEESPFRKVATLILPAQTAFTEARRIYFDDQLSFSPIHALEAHRPLGSVMRARMQTYRLTTEFRRQANGAEAAEPGASIEVPD